MRHVAMEINKNSLDARAVAVWNQKLQLHPSMSVLLEEKFPSSNKANFKTENLF